MSKTPLEAPIIIIGGGPVGLIAAHALHHANMDFIVLERRENMTLDEGASLVLHPQSLRVLHQLNLLDDLVRIGAEIHRNKALTRDGRVFRDTAVHGEIRKNYGIGSIAFHRADLVRVLYDRLPATAKERYLPGEKVVDVLCSDSGVQVTCLDGSSYGGAIVVGADGGNSCTRRWMRTLALTGVNTYRDSDTYSDTYRDKDTDTKKDQEACRSTWDAEDPFLAEYRCMWCSVARETDSDYPPAGETFETHDTNRSIMYVNGQSRNWMFVYERLGQPSRERVVYTADDMDAFAARVADMAVTETLTVQDIYCARLTGGMADLGEGVLRHWSWGRMVLVGDACHRFTPNAGQGLNSGIADVVALCNALYRHREGRGTLEDMKLVFDEYQALRRKESEEEAGESARLTRLQAWANGVYFVLARYVLASDLILYFFVNYISTRRARRCRVLEYIRAEEAFEGRVSWVNRMSSSI